ncbi:MAG: DNA repair protein RadC [Clostridiales Family XIII bacterium]|jgi:DNA repair protein RadC|nr:DNA repair protein RadC [Clostridiales Family XIII bacterium]
MPKIMELPSGERPRERLMKHGSESLSNTELLALLIGSGMKDESAMVIAMRVIAKLDGGISGLLTASPEELGSIKGIGAATSCKLLAAAELGRRASAITDEKLVNIADPEVVAEMFMGEMKDLPQECFRTLLINIKGELIGTELIAKGGINTASVEPRDVFRPAIRRGAAAVILLHNHPSGNPEPSISDVDATKTMIDAGNTIGIRVIDHLIIGNNKFASMARLELM